MSDEKRPINIYGGINSIATSATTATQTLNGLNGQAPQPAPVAQAEEVGEYHHFFTHDAIGVPKLIDHAKHHIVLHAAYYPKYSFDQQDTNVWNAMSHNTDLHLTAIFTDTEAAWADEFARTLRPYFRTAGDLAKKMIPSRDFFIECKKEFKDKLGNSRVHIYDSARLPFFPVILIDDTLIIGHYAHASVIPPDGLWLTIRHPRIPEMYATLSLGRTPTCSTQEEKAIVRYLEELIV